MLVRVDFNVPLDAEGQITSDARIRAALPTIEAILARGGKPILMSHLGRPKGKVVESMRLRPAAVRLGELLGRTVRAVKTCIGPEAEAAAASLADGEVLVLENLRFHPEEEKGDPEFAASLARLGDVFVSDAFGTAHRAHASVAGIAALLPSAAGLLLEREVDAFARVLEAPERPFVAVLGGAKVSDKIGVLQKLTGKVDTLLIGGAMAYTFLAAQGHKVGKSKVEDGHLGTARDILSNAKRRGVKVLLPVDHRCAATFAADAPVRTVTETDISDELMGLDIGDATAAAYGEALRDARTVFWNGPMGVFEFPSFAKGTRAVAAAIAASDAFSVVGGGDSVRAVNESGKADAIDHISTGGGASLEFIEGRELPGLTALGYRRSL